MTTRETALFGRFFLFILLRVESINFIRGAQNMKAAKLAGSVIDKAKLDGSLIDLEHDDLRPVAEIAEERTGRRPPPQTVWRWRLKGCRGAKLEAVLLHGTWHTTAAAFADFIRRQTENAVAACTAEGHEPAERETATERRLQAAGLM